jgi:hypothetical protein
MGGSSTFCLNLAKIDLYIVPQYYDIKIVKEFQTIHKKYQYSAFLFLLKYNAFSKKIKTQIKTASHQSLERSLFQRTCVLVSRLSKFHRLNLQKTKFIRDVIFRSQYDENSANPSNIIENLKTVGDLNSY